LGSALRGQFLSHPKRAWILLNVQVTLQNVVDLTVLAVQKKLQTSAQELTGDWLGYLERGLATPISEPIGPAPTQQLGAALYAIPHLEGFRTLSAHVPTHHNLVVFPDKLLLGSSIVMTDPATNTIHTIKPKGK